MRAAAMTRAVLAAALLLGVGARRHGGDTQELDVLLAGERLQRTAERRLDKVAGEPPAVTLPAELYLLLCSFLRRKDWVAVL